MIDAELGQERCDHLREATGDDRRQVAEPLKGAQQRARPRHELKFCGHRFDVCHRKASKERHPLAEGGGEVQLAGHGRLGDRCHLLLEPEPGRQLVDDLTLEERRVRIHDDQPLGATVESCTLDGDVDGFGDGELAEGGAQLFGVRASHQQLIGLDRSIAEADDALDVTPARRDVGEDGAEAGRLDHPRHQRHQQPTALRRGSFGRATDLHRDRSVAFKAGRTDGRFELNRRRSVAEADLEAQDEVSTDRDLADVGDLGGHLGHGTEQLSCESGRVAPRDRQQHAVLGHGLRLGRG